MSFIMRLVWRRWVRAGRSLRGQILIAMAFLIFMLHVIAQRQASPESAEDEALRNLEIGANGDPQRPTLPPDPPPNSSHEGLPLGPYGDWLEAAGSKREVFLYAAYLDRRGSHSQVVIVAILKRRARVSGCRVWTGATSTETTSKTKRIRENWNLLYSATLILCPVPNDARPTHVSLQAYSATLVPVQDMSARVWEGRMSVCVKPLHYQYDRALWLVEFIEFYRLLGADKFIFYNHTMGPSIEAVVKHYVDEGVVTLLPWSLPVVTQKEIRTEGIFAALNDCNLRSVYRYDFAAMVDFDEFLIPRRHDTLLNLLDSYNTKDGSYVFQNVFFYLYWENDTSVAYETLTKEGVSPVQGAGEPYLLTAFKTRRLDTPHKSGVRSKYIVRPEKVMELGNHQVWEYINAKMRKVPPSDGLSHHYRICEYGGFDCLKQPSHVDRTAHSWLARMYKRVLDHCALIFPDEGSCPVAPPLGSPY